jgi:hypothetical protein
VAYNTCMMESEKQYMWRRAQEEQDAADRAPEPKIRDLHIQLATRYRKAAEGRLPPRTPDTNPLRPIRPDDFRILE